ncbi:MAG TPA: Clp protease N-terminal domain-containing protein [Blastocatellia bacterium]|nr:Clp protease N-terminal domain-containing protein [Blastocatellia bacterium]
MFERYTEKARRTIFFARYEASQYGSPAIEPEHLLLGIVREDKALTARFLSRLTSIEAVRKEVDGRTVKNERHVISIDLALSPAAKRVLSCAEDESQGLGCGYIGTEHLLMGLLSENKSIAYEILYEQGLRLDVIRDDLRKNPHSNGESESSDEKNPFTQLIKSLKQHGVITEDSIRVEARTLRENVPFQALLNVLAQKGILTAEEFKKLSLGNSEDKKSDTDDSAIA